jgi:hypothetical protein
VLFDVLLDKMTGEQKTNTVADGIILFTLVSTVLVVAARGESSMGISAIRLTFTVLFAFALIRRANWARWLYGLLQIVGLLMTPFLFTSEIFKDLIYSWLGVWMLIGSIFNLWVVYCLLIDRSVHEYFTAKSENVNQAEKAAEQ